VIASLSRIDLRQVVATVAALLGLLVGAVSAVQPKIGLLAAIGVAFVALVFVDLFFGYAAMALFAFLEVLTVVGGVSLAKVAGAVIVLAWLATASLHNDRARNFFRERRASRTW